MDFITYYLSLKPAQRAELAQAAGTTPLSLRNVAYGYRHASAELALAIELESHGAVRVASTRPALADALQRAGYHQVATREPKAELGSHLSQPMAERQ